MKVKKLVPNAVIPKRAKPGDAGMDLTAVSYQYDEANDNHIYGTGIATEIPEGYVGLVFPRSSNRKTSAYLTNSVGVIDSGYRGEIMVTFKNRDSKLLVMPTPPYNVGDRVAQLVIVKHFEEDCEEVEELSETERGANGHGSTGA